MAPPGCSSLYVELSTRQAAASALATDEVVRALVEVRALVSPDDVVFADRRQIKYAYVIFDANYRRALDRIFPFLEEHRILSCGRYGSWIYNSMEDSLLAGRDVARQVEVAPAAAEES